MSWSISGSFSTIDAALHNLRHDAAEQGAGDQFDLAARMASEMISSGVVGDPLRHTFSVAVVGHANPGHEPREGWANDCITIAVNQR